jgi:membrane-bound lytic murein transglycosylase D
VRKERLRHPAKLTAVLLPFIILAALAVFDGTSYSWTLGELLGASDGGTQTGRNAFEFDPDRHIMSLPQSKGRAFFDTIGDLSICRNPEVRRFMYLYLTTGRDYLLGGIARSRQYIGMVEPVMKNYPEIPPDLALLPLLESGFNPAAVSHSNAVGLWQFLRGTSKLLGLKADRWVDDRRHIEKSTDAAMRHLRSLYGVFGSWELALAAYNGGAGYVRRAMIRTNTRNFWELRRSGALRAETAEYVARYAALTVLYRNQELFGLADEVTGQPIETAMVELNHPASINKISGVSGVPVETIRMLNPELTASVTPPYETRCMLRLPAEAAALVRENDRMVHAVQCSAVKKHVVRRGENLARIARRYHASPRSIMLINDISHPSRIRPGQTLYIPI